MCWSISQPSDKDGQLICTQLTTFNLFLQVNWLKQLALRLRIVLTISRRLNVNFYVREGADHYRIFLEHPSANEAKLQSN